MKKMSQRQQQRAEQVRQLASMALLRGEVMSTLDLTRLTILECWVSADLKLARLFVAVPAGQDEAAVLATANAELAGPLRKILAKNLGGKFVPAVSFWPLEDR